MGTGTLSGTLTRTTSAGAIIFTTLKITTAGNHIIEASCTDMVSDYTSSLAIDALALTSLTISISDTSISANVDFTVTVQTLEQSLGVWTEAASITLSSDGTLLGTLVETTSSGIATFTVYSLYSGLLTITATTGTKTKTGTITILQNKLKIESVDPTVNYI